jgi:uncharacterized repeat protein (TIGR04138 family)
MPPSTETEQQSILVRVAADAGIYPLEAFEFVERGLGYTVVKVHGTALQMGENRHVSGQQLCEGLREYAQHQWGLLARTVLCSWNIFTTMDFGRIVFLLAQHKVMQTSAKDNIEDFRDVFDFKSAFESGYRISSRI